MTHHTAVHPTGDANWPYQARCGGCGWMSVGYRTAKRAARDGDWHTDFGNAYDERGAA